VRSGGGLSGHLLQRFGARVFLEEVGVDVCTFLLGEPILEEVRIAAMW